MKLTFTATAIESLKETYEFLLQNSDRTAAVIYNDILDEIDRLLSFPQMASVEPMLEDEPEMFRSLVVKPHYKVIFYIAGETITVVDIWDCRKPPNALKTKVTRKK